MRIHNFVFAAVILTTPMVAQDPNTPTDWEWQLDAEQTLASDGELAAGEWWYVEMPPGWHITTTEQGVALFPKDTKMEGRWAIEVELFLFPDQSDEGFGIALQDLEGGNQLRFLFRVDGQAALEVRHGEEWLLAKPWVSDSLVAPYDGEGIEKYLLRVTYESGQFRFAVNGREMLSQVAPGDDYRIVPGLRVGKGLNLHVSRFDMVKPLAPYQSPKP
jgi:hypothetical protein